ncbi:NYN domain-containing protein [Hydrogenophaga sp.]|uniref:NYN domain-containing protein n=1 Tax=Hydrogenophaga sp. TaxID=1904254 RepID=UPI002724D857|nr:NYN domain-containing protein [Hydrogenophaga sp.]MDO9439041.1 NYN domain-containing protein [Hydrogenophaga sp.]
MAAAVHHNEQGEGRMTRSQSKQQKIAVLIDAENVSYTLVRPILLRAACYGTLQVKRAFADWTRPDMRRFRCVMNENAIEAVHLVSYARGKNAADITLCLNAMELVHTGMFDAVFLVSSDSDLTPLAFCIRREGVRVVGIGGQQTPRAFVKACSNFIYTESIAAVGVPAITRHTRFNAHSTLTTP